MRSSTAADKTAVIARLVVANRILAKHGIVDGFGHVSVRAAQPGTFYLSRSLAPASVTDDDILRFDLDGNTLDGDTRTPYLERFIHGEIFRVRPDVLSVIHNHSPSDEILTALLGQIFRDGNEYKVRQHDSVKRRYQGDGHGWTDGAFCAF